MQADAPSAGKVVAAEAGVDLRRATKLAEGDHQRVVEQAAVVQVVQQRAEHVIELGNQFEEWVSKFWPWLSHQAKAQSLNERHARFHQAAGDQALLGEERGAVFVPGGL